MTGLPAEIGFRPAVGTQFSRLPVDDQNMRHVQLPPLGSALQTVRRLDLAAQMRDKVTNINQYTFGNLVEDTILDAHLKTDGRRRVVSDACAGPCPIERGMRILGGKWTGSILWHLKDGPVRFNDLARMLGGASKKMVAERLRQLDERGLVSRTVLQTAPVSVEYEITEFGRTALTFLDALRIWSESLPRDRMDLA